MFTLRGWTSALEIGTERCKIRWKFGEYYYCMGNYSTFTTLLYKEETLYIIYVDICKLTRAIPVSYTHLDVYKRQGYTPRK